MRLLRNRPDCRVRPFRPQFERDGRCEREYRVCFNPNPAGFECSYPSQGETGLFRNILIIGLGGSHETT